jgi:zinc transporter ZupT
MCNNASLSASLRAQGEPYGRGAVLVGLVLGALFVAFAQAQLHAYGDVHFAHLRGGGARKTLLMVAIMTAHAFGEGAGVGVSFAGRRGWAEGSAVTAAIGVHNVPEGLAVATVLVAAGATPLSAAGWAVFTHLPQVLVAVPAFWFVDAFQALLPGAMGFASGCAPRGRLEPQTRAQ